VSPGVQLNLAMILFAPWFAVLSVLFWRYPRQPRGAARFVFDSIALATATVAAFGGMYWGMAHADGGYGPMWKQVFATSVAYGLYLGVMAAALIARMRWFGRPASPPRTPDPT